MSYKFSEETARVVIASWLQGEHIEDLKLVPVGSFPSPYMEIAKDMKAGADLEAIIKRHGYKVVTDATGYYSPALYRVAVQSVLQSEMHRTLPENATPEQLKAHAEKFARYWAEPPRPSDLAGGYLATLDKRAEQKPIDTGIGSLDDYTHGIYPGQLTIVAARPSVGKSAFCLQVARHVAYKGRKVLFLPLEMSAAETVDRMILYRVRQGVLTYKDLRRGRLEPAQWEEVNRIVKEIEDMADRFKVFENVRHITAIEELIRQEHPDLIVIDQLSQIQVDEAANTRERYVEVTRRLKAIALSEDVAIWLPCQMNRESSKTGAVSMDYLKESGSIEEDADIVLILAKKLDSDGNDTGERLLEVAKNRQGRCGKETLLFDAPRFKFSGTYKGFIETDNEPPF